MAQKKMKKGIGTAGLVGFGLTAAAVTAAGAYFLYGDKNAKNRKKVKGWVLKAKGEVLEALEKSKEITQDEYKQLVETASKAYGTVKHATSGEVKDFKKEMQKHWEQLENSKAMKKLAGAVKQPAKKRSRKKK